MTEKAPASDAGKATKKDVSKLDVSLLGYRTVSWAWRTAQYMEVSEPVEPIVYAMDCLACYMEPTGTMDYSPRSILMAFLGLGLFIERDPFEVVAEVMAVGEAKYGRNNWREKGGLKWSRVGNAAMRHLREALEDPDRVDDGEGGTGCTHIACAMTNIWFLLSYAQFAGYVEGNDRWSLDRSLREPEARLAP